MATQAPPATAKKKAPVADIEADDEPKAPPSDSVWVKYNQHGEAHISLGSSFALHALGIGLLFILGYYIFDQNKAKPLPIEAIEISGGGKGIGNGIGDGVGSGEDLQSGAGIGDSSAIEGPPQTGDLTLEPDKLNAMKQEFKDDPAALRAIEKGKLSAADLRAMSTDKLNRLRTGMNPGGKNGTGGVGGVAGGNDGDGTGGKKGRPKNARQKRQDRWAIDFERASPVPYLNQLESIGAFLAIPVSYDGDKATYRSIHDLKKRPAKVTNEDPGTLGMIYWFQNDPIWTEIIMRELQIDKKPSHFIVLFPLELEKEFADEEQRYLKAKGLKEENIKYTRFHLEAKGKRVGPVAYSHDVK